LSLGLPSLDIRSLDVGTFDQNVKFARSILHYGVKAIAQASFAHHVLSILECGQVDPSDVIARFEVEDSPLSISLKGLERSQIPVPHSAITAAEVFWPGFFRSAERFAVAHPDFLNPILAARNGYPDVAAPSRFFKREWSLQDLNDRPAMAALLINATLVWDSALTSFRKNPESDPISLSAREELISGYARLLDSYTSGDSRVQSLILGRSHLQALVDAERTATARALEIARRAAEVGAAAAGPSISLHGAKPATPEPPPPSPSPSPSPVDRTRSAPKIPPENAVRVELARHLTRDLLGSDPEVRADAAKKLREWSIEPDREVREMVMRGVRLAGKVFREEAKLSAVRERIENGDPNAGLRALKELSPKLEVAFVRDAARKLAKVAERAIESARPSPNADTEWRAGDGEGALRDVLINAFRRGAAAEVVTGDGKILRGRLAYRHPDSRLLRLLDLERERTAEVPLFAVRSLKLFVDETSQPERALDD